MSTLGSQGLDQAQHLIEQMAPQGAVEIERRESSLVLRPRAAGTYEVTIYDEGDQAMVSCERWHSHYDDPVQVAFCALWLLSPFYRIVHEFKGGLLAAVWVDRYEAEGWVGMEPVFFLNPDHPADWDLGRGEGFSRTYLAQDVVPSTKPYDAICPGAKLGADGLPIDFRAGTWTVQAGAPLSLDIE